MRTSLDIPDDLFRILKMRAASEGTTIREILLEGLAQRLQKKDAPAVRPEGQPRFPVLQSRNPGSLKLGKEGVYEYIPFP